MRIVILMLLAVCCAGCRLLSPPASTPEIINGNESSLRAVVPVVKADGSSYCTAGLITQTIAITARHCIVPTAAGCGVTVAGKTPAACFVDESWVEGNTSATNAVHDVAVLVLHAGDKIVWPGWSRSELLRFGPNSRTRDLLGARVQIAGYGRTDWQGHASDQEHISGGQGAGIGGSASVLPLQHQCSNVISAIDLDSSSNSYGLIHFSAEDRSDGACMPSFGDSGGPLLRWDSAKNSYYIVGVASTVFYPATGKQDAAYVVLFADVAMGLLEKATSWSEKDTGL